MPKEVKKVREDESAEFVLKGNKQSIPNRNKNGEFVFPDYPTFRPNLSPEEILRAGSFGGTYFRPIKSY